jgi:hypothetical protein
MGKMVKRKIGKSAIASGRGVNYAALASRIALSAMPGGPAVKLAALAAKHAVKAAYSKYKSRKKSSSKSSRSKWNNTSTGVYAGKFKRPMKAKMSPEKMALRSGFHRSNEMYGRIEDPHAVYLTHSTFVPDLIAESLAGNFIRKILKKAGIDISNRDEQVPFFSNDNSDGFKLEYVTIDPITGAETLFKQEIPIFRSLTIITQDFTAFTGHLSNYLKATVATEPHALLLYSSDRNGIDTNWRLAASLYLREQVVSTHVQSSLKVQNRTAGDTAVAGDKDTDRVDNQPLKGKLYDFKHGNPRLKYIRAEIATLTTVRLNGIQLIRAAELGNQYENMPSNEIWNNCSKTANQMMQPGQIKKTTISYNYKGKLINFLNKYRADTTNANHAGSSYGRCQLLMLEEKLRTVGTNPVTIQYEREIKVGTYSKGTKPSAITTVFSASEFNNLPV